MPTKPIKRHESLKAVSREHHFGLLICWKIREGFRKEVDLKRIKAYTDWAWKHQLVPHFAFEEEHLFTILPEDHDHIKRALAEHRRLQRLFEQEDELYKSLSLIEEELEQHIRFEERVLFNEIQEVATEEELLLIAKHHSVLIKDDWEDEFWK